MQGVPKAARQPAKQVLVLGEDDRILLAIARSLGRQNIGVHIGWCRANSLAKHSRYVRRVHDIPAPLPGSDRWKAVLHCILAEERFELVIPATDSAVFVLQQAAEEITAAAPLCVIEGRAYEVAYDKLKTVELARSLGIPVPRGAVTGRSETDPSLSQLRLPAFVKPACSVHGEDTLGKQFVRQANTVDELRAHVKYLLERSDRVLVQEQVPGSGVAVSCLASNGEILFAYQHARLHETTGFGGTYRQSVPLDADLLAASSRLLAALDYTGVAMVEFKVDAATGEWHLLEINGRFWGSLPLAIAAGADFPLSLYQMLVDGRRDFEPTYRHGVRCRSLTGDLRWWWRTLRKKHRRLRVENDEELGWGVNQVPTRRLWADLTRALTFQDYVDSFSWDDPQPVFAEIWAAWNMLLDGRFRRRRSGDQAVEPPSPGKQLRTQEG